MLKRPNRMTLCALAMAGSSLLSPISINLTATEAHACLPEQLPDPILLSATHEDGSIPVGSGLIFKVDGSFDETDATVSVDGSQIDTNITLKTLFLSSMVHITLPDDLSEGSEVSVSFPNASGLTGESIPLELTFTTGAAIEAETTELSEVNFDYIVRSPEDFNSCDAYASQTRFFVAGSDLDVEWLYADFVVGGSRLTRLIRPDVVDGILEVSINHDSLDDTDIGEQSAGLTLYDVYGRQFSIRAIGGCRYLTQIDGYGAENATYRLVEENEEGCGLGAGEYTEAEPGLDPITDPEGDPTGTDPDQDPQDPEDPEDPEGEEDEERDEVADEESSGCEQSRTSQSTSLYLLLLAGLSSIFSRRRRGQHAA